MVSLNSMYSLLGVSTSSSTQEVKASYFRLARLYHPDKIKQADPSTPSFVSIRSAYEAVLADMQKRTAEKKKSEEYRRLSSQIVNIIGLLLTQSDSEEEEINDGYFEARAKMMDLKYNEVKSLFKRGENKAKLSQNSNDTDSSETATQSLSPDKKQKQPTEDYFFKDPIRKKTKNK